MFWIILWSNRIKWLVYPQQRNFISSFYHTITWIQLCPSNYTWEKVLGLLGISYFCAPLSCKPAFSVAQGRDGRKFKIEGRRDLSCFVFDGGEGKSFALCLALCNTSLVGGFSSTTPSFFRSFCPLIQFIYKLTLVSICTFLSYLVSLQRCLLWILSSRGKGACDWLQVNLTISFFNFTSNKFSIAVRLCLGPPQPLLVGTHFPYTIFQLCDDTYIHLLRCKSRGGHFVHGVIWDVVA